MDKIFRQVGSSDQKIVKRLLTESVSPFNLLQEQLRDDPWKVLIACMMLNQTSSTQVKRVVWEFFQRWPTPYAVVKARREEITQVIKSLGFQNRRAWAIIKMSCDYVCAWKDVKELFGIGKYASDSYRMFCQGELVMDVEDKELKNVRDWILSQYLQSSDVSKEADETRQLAEDPR